MAAVLTDEGLTATGLVVIDFETVTPRGYPPEPIEVAVQSLRIRDGQLLHGPAWSALMRPPPHAPLTPFDSGQTGITEAMLNQQPDAASVLAELDRRFTAPPYLLVAHNAPTEAGVLALYQDHCPTLATIDLLDTVRLARVAYPDLPSHGLDALINYLRLPRPRDRHRAAADVSLTVAVLERLLATGCWDSLADLRECALFQAKANRTRPAATPQVQQAELF